MSIGENIKRLRKLSGLEQTELAERLHVSNKTISSWECDRTEPKIGMIEEMSKIFGCKKTDIIEMGSSTIPESLYDPITNQRFVSYKDLLEAYIKAPSSIQISIKKLLDLDDKKED